MQNLDSTHNEGGGRIQPLPEERSEPKVSMGRRIRKLPKDVGQKAAAIKACLRNSLQEVSHKVKGRILGPESNAGSEKKVRTLARELAKPEKTSAAESIYSSKIRDTDEYELLAIVLPRPDKRDDGLKIRVELKAQFSPREAQLIAELSKKFPLMSQIVQHLPTELDEEGERGQHYQSIKILARVLSELSQDASSAEALRAVTPDHKALRLFFLKEIALTESEQKEGKKPLQVPKFLTEAQIPELKTAIQKVIDSRPAAPKEPIKTSSLAAEMRLKPDPTTIGKLAELWDAERETKAIAKEIVVEDQKISVNWVAKFDKTFFKEGSGGDNAAGQMEKIMYDLAVLSGKTDRFAATKTSKLETKKVLGEEETVSREGGIQTAIKGMSLDDFLDKTQAGELKTLPKISHQQVVEATLTQATFGMFDFHGANMIIDSNGNINLFDNTRSMPNSNGAIRWPDGQVMLAFRSGLLALPQSYQPLTSGQRKKVAAQIQIEKKNVEKWEKFLANPLTQKRLAALPYGWWGSGALDAAKERVARLESAIQKPSVKNLRDLTFEVFPEGKLAAVLHLATESKYHLDGRESFEELLTLQKKYLGGVGYTDMNELFSNASDDGLDLHDVKKWCEDPSLSFEEAVVKTGEVIDKHFKQKKLIENLFEQKAEGLQAEGLQAEKLKAEELEAEKLRRSSATALLNEWFGKAALDYKDFPREESERLMREEVAKQCKSAGIQLAEVKEGQDLADAFKLKATPGQAVMFCEQAQGRNDRYFLLSYSVGGTINQHQVDVKREVGRFYIDGLPLERHQLCSVDQPDYYQADICGKEAAGDFLKAQSRLGWILRRGAESESANLYISATDPKGKLVHLPISFKEGYISVAITERQWPTEFTNIESLLKQVSTQYGEAFKR